MAQQADHRSPVNLPDDLRSWQLGEGRQESTKESTQGSKLESISRCFTFSNFRQAFAFMTQVAMLAEKANHHPNWQNTYNEVIITLTTHSENAVTEKDFDLARKIDKIYKN